MIGNLLPARAGWLAGLGGAALLAACTVDPYTGALVGGYATPAAPAYGSAPPGYAGGPGYGPPQGPDMQTPGQGWAGGGGMGPGGGGNYGGGQYGGGGHGHLAQRFAAANTSQDGRLTLQQAEAANWRQVARHFAMIDAQHKGFVTMQDIRAWRAQRRAMQGGGYGGQGGGEGQMGYGGGAGPAGYGGGPGPAGYRGGPGPGGYGGGPGSMGGGPDEGEY